jgi:hypothetical protein
MALPAKRHVSGTIVRPGPIPIGATTPTTRTAGAVARQKGACTTTKMGIFPTCESPSDASTESIESGFAKSNRKRRNRPFPLGPVWRHDRRPGPTPPGARPAMLPRSAREPPARGSRCSGRFLVQRQIPGAVGLPSCSGRFLVQRQRCSGRFLVQRQIPGAVGLPSCSGGLPVRRPSTPAAAEGPGV